MSMVADKLRERLESGILFYLGARGHRFLTERFLRKQLKKYADLAGPGVAIGAEMAGVTRMARGFDKYLGHVIDAVSDFGIYKTAELLIEGKPVCYFEDANTIRVFNLGQTTLDPAAITVKIDGTAVPATGISSVTGTGDDFTIALASPVQAGKHELVVVGDGSKACYNPEAYA